MYVFALCVYPIYYKSINFLNLRYKSLYEFESNKSVESKMMRIVLIKYSETDLRQCTIFKL